jgi:Ran GTPase-activating protein (RanGAP) involved in mRNA processing and transport
MDWTRLPRKLLTAWVPVEETWVGGRELTWGESVEKKLKRASHAFLSVDDESTLCAGFGQKGAKHIANALQSSDMRAMTKLNISKNCLTSEGGRALAVGLKGNQVMTELNIASNSLTLNDHGSAYDDMSGVAAVANTISGMGSLTSLHVGENNIPEKEMREIMAIALHMDSMKILCGVPFKDKTLTELDVSGKNLGTEGALVIAEYLEGNGALIKLDISSNAIGAKQEEDLQRICMASGIELAK